MQAFNQKIWHERKKVLGQPAETAFQIYAKKTAIRLEHFGLKTESDLNYSKLKLFLRLRPDYICQQAGKAFFVEVKGCGQDAVLKFKIESIEALYTWQLLTPVYIFLWDSSRQHYCFMAYEFLREKLYQCQTQRFDNDQKPYFALLTSMLQWEVL